MSLAYTASCRPDCALQGKTLSRKERKGKGEREKERKDRGFLRK